MVRCLLSEQPPDGGGQRDLGIAEATFCLLPQDGLLLDDRHCLLLPESRPSSVFGVFGLDPGVPLVDPGVDQVVQRVADRLVHCAGQQPARQFGDARRDLGLIDRGRPERVGTRRFLGERGTRDRPAASDDAPIPAPIPPREGTGRPAAERLRAPRSAGPPPSLCHG